MPDISLRFHKDMLVLSSPVAAAFDRLGIDVQRDFEMTMLLEPETVEDAYKLESMAGAQCFVAPTATLTRARLAHGGMEERAQDLAGIALAALRPFRPQHVLVELAPCGLPLDPSSKASLVENRDQYARFARLFEGAEFDAFFLNSFATCDDLKCALMGVRKVSDAPAFASVDVLADGTLASGRGTLEEAVAVMQEFESSVVGFATRAGQDEACALAERVVVETSLPLLVQLEVARRTTRQQGPMPENPYYCADTMMAAGDALRRAGAQFLRAAGDATPAYTGTLVATTVGLDAKPLPRVISAEDARATDGKIADKPGAIDGHSAAKAPAIGGKAADKPATVDGKAAEELGDFIEQMKKRVDALL